VHCSPSKYQSRSVQTVGFGVGQVGEVPHDGLRVGDVGTDLVIIDGSGVGSGIRRVGVTEPGVVGSAGEGWGVVLGKG
jgi:hypothetical protein